MTKALAKQFSRSARATRLLGVAVVSSAVPAYVTGGFGLAGSSTPATGLTTLDPQSVSDLQSLLGPQTGPSTNSYPSGVTFDQTTQLISQIGAAFGVRYGGFWVDHTQTPNHLVFAIQDLSPSDSTKVASIAGTSTPYVDLVDVKYSAVQLSTYEKNLESAMQSSGLGMAGGMDVNPKTGRIDVMSAASGQYHIDPNSLASAAAQAHVPQDALALIDVQAISFHNTYIQNPPGNRNTFPPYKGGLEISNTIGSCTSSFMFDKGGSVFGSTAGHCYQNTDSVFVPGSGYNGYFNVFSSTYGLRVDGELLGAIPSSARTGTVLQSPGFYYNVTGAMHDSDLAPGEVLCFSGITSGESCGSVELVHYEFVYQDMTCTANASLLGDSGAPAYKVNGSNPNQVLAAGIESGDLTVEIGGVAEVFGCSQALDPFSYLTGATIHTAS